MTGAKTSAIITSMLKTIVGAGMLALPFSYRQQGAIVAALMISFAALTTGLGLYFQSISAGFLPKGQASFSSVCRITYPRLAVLFDLAIAIKCFGVAVSYLIIVGNLCPIIADYFELGGPWLDNKLWVTLALVTVGPLCFKRTLESLKYTSIVGLVSASYLVILIVGHYFKGDTLDDRGPVELAPHSLGDFFTSLPIILFSYTCAQNMYQALNELADDSPSQIGLLITTCLGGSCAIYLLVATLGYLSFGDNVTDNIIAMYPQSALSTLGRFAMVILVLFSYPLQIHPSRGSVVNIVTVLREPPAPLLADDAEEQEPAVDNTLVRRATAALLILSYALAMSVKSLEVVLSFVGSIGATSISFILPGFFGYKLSSPDFQHTNRIFALEGRRGVLRGLSIALIAWGFLTFTLGLGANVYRLLK